MKTIDIITHQTDLSPEEFGAEIMKKRVRSPAYPDELYIDFGGKTAKAYRWTDGIHDIVSLFFREDELVKELCIVDWFQ